MHEGMVAITYKRSGGTRLWKKSILQLQEQDIIMDRNILKQRWK